MRIDEVPKIVASFAGLAHFEDGRIDYSNSKKAPVVSITVRHSSRILILKRSGSVLTYRGKWNNVAGYLDEEVSLRAKVLEELRQETGIMPPQIKSIVAAKPYEFSDILENTNN